MVAQSIRDWAVPNADKRGILVVGADARTTSLSP